MQIPLTFWSRFYIPARFFLCYSLSAYHFISLFGNHSPPVPIPCLTGDRSGGGTEAIPRKEDENVDFMIVQTAFHLVKDTGIRLKSGMTLKIKSKKLRIKIDRKAQPLSFGIFNACWQYIDKS